MPGWQPSDVQPPSVLQGGQPMGLPQLSMVCPQDWQPFEKHEPESPPTLASAGAPPSIPLLAQKATQLPWTQAS
jgi:hypothetical protein